MKDDENPCLVYDAEDGPNSQRSSHIPIVMIHDGGGTCFAYYCLNPIGRPMYEIHNPHFYSGKPWPGGIPEMAQHYVGLMRKMVPRGRILLGGWSLGGLLSLEMARILADDPLYTVIGIVMVDSICPVALRPKTELANTRVAPYQQKFGPNTKKETIEGVERCFAEARTSVETYQLPSWDEADRESEQEAANGTSGTENEKPQSLQRGPAAKVQCPPTILLRARDAVPADPEEVSFVDLTREERTLGWDKYRKDFIQEIVDIPGHHFNIFAWEHIDTVSEKLMAACTTLERMATKALYIDDGL
ncbi:hypothetical protein VMCG_10320 [Cytospora schulzeri]|uniref:Thioesterase domain-containing protein n=1 Tax=Cytospora schulzeri TaxID=448051 RepID=A0A423VCL0_9PEZI|nr:hypothetical protein VMCG_10320 [Valsa malicola]